MLCFFHDLSAEDYVRLRSSVGWTPLIREQAQSCLENSDFIVSCRESDETVGCARVFWDKGYIAYLADVIVIPEYQGQGIGKRLTEAAMEALSREGIFKTALVVFADNDGGNEFWEKLGFTARTDLVYRNRENDLSGGTAREQE